MISDGGAGLPFAKYPGGGRVLLGKRILGTCRHDYGLQYYQRTHVHTCGYCGLDLTSSYGIWLNIALDHALPISVCNKLEIWRDWMDDYSNSVLTCSACNSFDNRYKPTFSLEKPMFLEEFFTLRDRVFVERRDRILKAHEREEQFFREKWCPAKEGNTEG